GRFCQTDPAGYIDTMNLYAYCSNNPVNWIDPFGLLSGIPAIMLDLPATVIESPKNCPKRKGLTLKELRELLRQEGFSDEDLRQIMYQFYTEYLKRNPDAASDEIARVFRFYRQADTLLHRQNFMGTKGSIPFVAF
ncbi:MAG TPA: RHS repeat-associated core domain-containing protein, partial [Anaerohalosphaeraceae bacterium]|nr:RHS repeat-associated core domain-containing protein [Anaerohalosphaeraceae bacterium]